MRSQLARMQQVLMALLLGASVAWAWMLWARSPTAAIVGALCILFSYVPVLALQCILLWHVSATDTAPRPTVRELVRTWWAEVLLVPPVFVLRQPFLWRAYPDRLAPSPRGQRGIVFIHGFVCNRGFWRPWLARMHAEGRPFVAVNLEPVFGSIDDYAAIIDAAIESLRASTGLAPALVCHSMGGLAARAWLRVAADRSRVHRIVTIGTPHRGTWLGRFGRSPNGIQMRAASGWLAALDEHEAAHPQPPFTCWYSHCDHIVFPTSSAMRPGADNRLVRGAAHVELAFVPEVIEGTLKLVDEPLPV